MTLPISARRAAYDSRKDWMACSVLMLSFRPFNLDLHTKFHSVVPPLTSHYSYGRIAGEMNALVRRQRAEEAGVNILRTLLHSFFWAGTMIGLRAAEIENPSSIPRTTIEPEPIAIWQDGVGGGFQRSARSFTAEPGAAAGLKVFGTRQAHNLGLLSISYGHIWGPVVGGDHWYRGNFEARLELFTGAQFSPSSEWLVALTPHLRYNFATGTRCVPFFDVGTGVAATSIGPPDL